MKSVVFHPEADQEYEDARLFYEFRRSGLGTRFRAAVLSGLRTIRRDPRIGTPVAGTPCRKLLVEDFPYKLIYSEQPAVLQIVAVAHASRDPDYWRHRIIP